MLTTLKSPIVRVPFFFLTVSKTIESCMYNNLQGVFDYRDDWVQKMFPDNGNPGNFCTTISRIEIPIIEELPLWMEYFIDPGIVKLR